MSDGPCGECVSFTVDGVPGKLLERGFGRCVEMPKWAAQSARAACGFVPVRFRVKAQAIAPDAVKPVTDGLPEEIDFR